MVSLDAVVKKAGLPAGDYMIVAWDLDTTGSKLIDEFCQIAAYTPGEQFSQYVMPFKDLAHAAKKRHLVKTVNVGRYRMLKDLKIGKFVNTRSEIYALTDFLDWLEKIKGQNGPGIILLSYETNKLAPLLLLEALKRYQLLDRFTSLVKGFGDCFSYVKQKCDATLNSFSLRVVSKVLLDKNDDVARATDRARLAYQIVQHLVAGDVTGEGDAVGMKQMVEAVRGHSSSVADDLNVINDMKVVLQRQNTLRPIFAPLMMIDPPNRRHAVSLRGLLVAALLDYDSLKALWEQGKETLEETVRGKLSEATEEQRTEVCKLICDHFDPNVNTAGGEAKRYRRRNNRKSNAKDNDQTVNSDIPSTPNTTASNTSTSSPSKSNGVETPQDESPSHRPTTSVKPDVLKETTNVDK